MASHGWVQVLVVVVTAATTITAVPTHILQAIPAHAYSDPQNPSGPYSGPHIHVPVYQAYPAVPIHTHSSLVPPVPAAPRPAKPLSTAPTGNLEGGPYWASESMVGQEVECSDAAKECLALRRLLHEPTGGCYEPGDNAPCAVEENLVLDQEELRKGRLHATCRRANPCAYDTDDKVTMAFDGQCHSGQAVVQTLCPGVRRLAFHPLGGFECVPLDVLPSARKEALRFRQPPARGRCALPNFWNSAVGPFRVACSQAQAACLRNRTLPFEGDCHYSLSSAPCPQGQRVVLDEGAANEGILRVGCAEDHCAPDGYLLRADGACHGKREVRDRLCPFGTVPLLPTGETACTKSAIRYEVQGEEVEPGVCEMRFNIAATAVATINAGSVLCPLNDSGHCLQSVTKFKPQPSFKPEP